MEKKRVLWLTNTPALLTKELTGVPVVEGSWISAMESLIRERQPEIELHIAFAGGENPGTPVKRGNVTCHPLPRPCKFARFLRRIFLVIHTKSELKSVKEVVEQVRPSVIHVFGTESFFGLIVGETNIPVVVQIQGIVASFIPVYFGNRSFRSILIAAGVKDLIVGGVFFRYFIEKRRAKRENTILKQVAYVIGRTRFDEEFSAEINPGRKYFHLDDPLRKEFFESNWQAKENPKLQLFTVIHAEYYKGFDLLIETVLKLTKSGINFVWRVAGIGDDYDIVKVTIKAMHLNQLPEGIILLGKVSAKELAKTMLESDIYVHTSFIENSSNSICEAMLMGLPVIAAGVGGTPSIIEDGKTGYLYKKGDSKELCNLILDIFNSPDRGAQLGKNGRAVALKRHDGEKIVENLIMIYDQITSGQVDRESR